MLLDECVDRKLEDYLIRKGVDCDIIRISGEYCGKSDDFVAGMCYALDAILVTSDKKFYGRFPERKVYHSNDGNEKWNETYESEVYHGNEKWNKTYNRIIKLL